MRVEAAVDPFSLGPALVADLAARRPGAGYPKELARRLRVGSVGTGFFVNSQGDLVTNAHVVLSGIRFRGLHFSGAEWDSLTRTLETIRDIWVTVGEGEEARSYVATPVAVAEDLDLAVLRVSRPPEDKTEFAALPVAASDKVRVGSSMVVLGFPEDGYQESDGEVLSLVHGWEVHEDLRLVRSTDPLTGKETITVSGTSAGPVVRLQHSAATGHGSSGGPVLDEPGRVIGVAYALLSDQNGVARTDLNLAIASNVLRRFLKEHGVAYTEVEP